MWQQIFKLKFNRDEKFQNQKNTLWKIQKHSDKHFNALNDNIANIKLNLLVKNQNDGKVRWLKHNCIFAKKIKLFLG